MPAPKAAPVAVSLSESEDPPPPKAAPQEPRAKAKAAAEERQRQQQLRDPLIQEGLDCGVSIEDIRPNPKAIREGQIKKKFCEWYPKRPLPARVDVHLRAPPER